MLSRNAISVSFAITQKIVEKEKNDGGEAGFPLPDIRKTGPPSVLAILSNDYKSKIKMTAAPKKRNVTLHKVQS